MVVLTRSARRRMLEQDLLSQLPEELIVRILSKLEMKDAVKTGILSKRWKNLWTQVDNLVYICHDPTPGHLCCFKRHKFISFVDNSLRQCTGKVKKFYFSERFGAIERLRFGMDPNMFGDWIKFVLEKNVEHLKLCFEDDECFSVPDSLPDSLYEGSSLTKLELGNLIVEVNSIVNWTSLKELILNDSYLDDESMDNILMGCPMLETMHLSGFHYVNHINIMSPSMKILNIVRLHYYSEEEIVLEIRAPWLRELVILDYFVVNKCKLVDVSSLVKATLKFFHYEGKPPQDNNSWIGMVSGILKSVSHVDELIIGSHPIQILTLSKLMGKPSLMFKCKHLAVESYLWKYDLPGIACILENAPHLETLSINVLDRQALDPLKENPIYEMYELFSNGDPHLNMPKGNFPHLKKVTVDFSQCYGNNHGSHGQYFDFEIVDYILRSAVVLKKLVLSSSRSGHCRGSNRCQIKDNNCSFQYVPRLSRKLQSTYLIRNEAGEWEPKKSKNKFEFNF